MFEKAGELYEQMEKLQRALDCYVKGNVYKKAVDLAKNAEPRLVASLEERWGNYLVSIKQTQAAIHHFIEAEKIQKAIEASITARDWNKAIQLLAHQTPEVARPYYRQIAKHYATIRQYDFAEKYYLKAALPVDAFEMYAEAGKWEQALRVAK
jgi:intraflagellar transport protein 172